MDGLGTERSDFPNQVNNVPVFPGICKGALLAKVSQITEDTKLAAARATTDMVLESDLEPKCILPWPFTEGIADRADKAVRSVANKEA